MGSIGRLRAVEEWNEVSRLEVDGHVSSVSFSPDSRLLASGSYAKETGQTSAIILWDVTAEKELRRFDWRGDWVTWVSFSPDGHLLASAAGDHTIHLWEVSSGRELACVQDCGGNFQYSSSFSPDGRFLASVGRYGSGVIVIEIPSGRKIEWFHLSDSGGEFHTHSYVAFSPDGRILAFDAYYGNRDHSDIILWDLSLRKEVNCLKGLKYFIQWILFSPDGRLLATASWPNTIQLWEVSSGKELRSFKGHEGNCIMMPTRLAFSPDGMILASGSFDNTVRIWNVSSGKQMQQIGYPQIINDLSLLRPVSFSPNGRLLASGSLDRTILIFKPELSIDKVLRHFKQVGQVDASLLEELVREYREKGKLLDLAEALQKDGFYEEAAEIYDDLGQAPKKSKSQSTQRPKELKPSAWEADSTKSACPNCDSEIKANWLECPECGASLKEKVCQNCGERLEPHWKRCPACRRVAKVQD
ncbi:MAG: zinc ribbon domain-containing protein [Deltaproteobacteria bacterium]|nr:zinc ribbon domain-containing protein [Deltaproteobacteria bacterium]